MTKRNQLSKREYKYRCKIIAENHLKKELQQLLDKNMRELGISYKLVLGLAELKRMGAWDE